MRRRTRRTRTAPAERPHPFRVLARAGKVAAWTALMPLTGRTHQLRAHCAAIGCPILGDGKYGGKAAHPTGAPKGLMLHARELDLPRGKGRLRLKAEPPRPFKDALGWVGMTVRGPALRVPARLAGAVAVSDAAARPAHRRAAFAFIFVTVMLDMLALGHHRPGVPEAGRGLRRRRRRQGAADVSASSARSGS